MINLSEFLNFKRNRSNPQANENKTQSQSVAQDFDNQDNSENSAIKVTIVGAQGVGKTCFLLGMYGGMTAGFQLHSVAHNQRVNLDNLWSELVAEGSIQGTTENDSFELELWDSRMSLTRIHWIDYAGGALTNNSSVYNVDELRDFLAEADCLFLCIDGQYLMRPVKEKDVVRVRTQAKVNLMLHYLQDYSKRRDRREILPVVITISKYDLCLLRIQKEKLKIEADNLSQKEKQNQKDELLAKLQQDIEEEIKRIFEPLFERPVYEPGWLVMICPFTLGEEFAKWFLMPNDPSSQEERNLFQEYFPEDTEEIDFVPAIVPKNYHFPVVFALWARLREKGWEIKEKLQIIDEYSDAVDSEMEEKILVEERKALEKELENIIVIVNNKLIEHLEDVSIYKDGNRVKPIRLSK